MNSAGKEGPMIALPYKFEDRSIQHRPVSVWALEGVQTVQTEDADILAGQSVQE